MKTQFKINNGPVVFENYNNEVVAVNLDSGAYYSLVGASSQLWNLIFTNHSVEQISTYFIATLEGDSELIKSALYAILTQLEEAGLIIENLSTEPSPAISATESAIEKTSFNGFDMMVYTDMQDLLLLDPIHDVDDSGWPAASGDPIK